MSSFKRRISIPFEQVLYHVPDGHDKALTQVINFWQFVKDLDFLFGRELNVAFPSLHYSCHKKVFYSFLF